MKKIYIAGAGGMLGDAFYKVFSNDYELFCSDINVNETWLNLLDFRNFNKYLEDVNKFKPDYLFHLGAYTDLEYCEKNIDDTYLTNTKSVESATKIANKFDIPIFYVSTAGIFDGKKDLYDELDKPNPIGHYAKSKYAGEIFIQNNANKYLICRAGWMMGGGPKKDKKFVNKILRQISSGSKKLYIINDKFGTPTYTDDFAMNTKKLIENNIWGLYNLVCEGLTSRLEVAKEILNNLNLQQDIIINEVDSNYFKKEYFAPRPYSERLINSKLNDKNLNIMRDWKICLSEYLSRYNFLEKLK